MFLGKGVLRICSKFTGEHLCQSVISIKLLCDYSEQLLTTELILHKAPSLLLYFKQKLALFIARNIHFLQFLLVLTVDEARYISNKYQLLNNLAKHQYFYTKTLYIPPSYPSSAKVFRNIYFQHFFIIFKIE